MLSYQFLAKEFFRFLCVKSLLGIRGPEQNERIGVQVEERAAKTDLGARVELSCNLRSLFTSFSTTVIWSPLQTRTTVASNTFARPSAVVVLVFAVAVGGALAYRHARFSLATFSAARKRSIPPPLANIPACQSTGRARPAATRCSATLPAGCNTKNQTELGKFYEHNKRTCPDKDTCRGGRSRVGGSLERRSRRRRKREDLHSYGALQESRLGKEFSL